MASYSGPLQSLRRPELLELVKDLDVAPKHNGYLSKYELVELVRATLKSDRDKRHDARFSGIWQHMPESQLQEDELERLVHDNGAAEDPLLHVQVGTHTHFDDADPHRSLDQLYSTTTTTTTTDTSPSQSDGGERRSPLPSMREAILHPHIFDTLRQASPRKFLDQLEDQVEEVGPLALVPASRSLRRKASRSLSLVTKQSSHNLRVVARGSVAVVAEAQYRLSSSWFLILAILFAEYSFIVYEALPFAEYSFGPYPSLVLPDLPPISFHVPAFHFLLHPFFTLALVRYSLQTLLLPLVLSLIFAFPRPTSSAHDSEPESEGTDRRARRRRARRALSTPSPLIFALARLSIALLKGYILASPASGEPTQALHEIASHSRLALSKTLKTLLHEAAAQSGHYAPGLTTYAASWRTTGWKGLVGGIAGRGHGERRWKVEEIVEAGTSGGIWGVVALGMGVAAVVAGVEN
ncbi:hypothetical protein JCM11491_004168 [Sporobolomyces phaffii]